jgi:hypothetical protein
MAREVRRETLRGVSTTIHTSAVAELFTAAAGIDSSHEQPTEPS